jgi:hypothetical protein
LILQLPRELAQFLERAVGIDGMYGRSGVKPSSGGGAGFSGRSTNKYASPVTGLDTTCVRSRDNDGAEPPEMRHAEEADDESHEQVRSARDRQGVGANRLNQPWKRAPVDRARSNGRLRDADRTVTGEIERTVHRGRHGGGGRAKALQQVHRPGFAHRRPGWRCPIQGDQTRRLRVALRGDRCAAARCVEDIEQSCKQDRAGSVDAIELRQVDVDHAASGEAAFDALRRLSHVSGMRGRRARPGRVSPGCPPGRIE